MTSDNSSGSATQSAIYSTTHSKISAEYPAIWRRFAAIIYDTLLILAISMGYGGLGIAINHFFVDNTAQTASGIVFQLGWFAVLIGFFCFFWSRAGQTLGMRTWRLRIINSSNGKSPSVAQCLARLALSPIGLCLFFTAFLRKDKQLLHDHLTGTALVFLMKEKKK